MAKAKTRNIGEKNGLAKLTEHDVLMMRRLVDDGVQVKQVAAKFGVSNETARKAVLGITWKNAGGKIWKGRKKLRMSNETNKTD